MHANVHLQVFNGLETKARQTAKLRWTHGCNLHPTLHRVRGAFILGHLQHRCSFTHCTSRHSWFNNIAGPKPCSVGRATGKISSSFFIVIRLMLTSQPSTTGSTHRPAASMFGSSKPKKHILSQRTCSGESFLKATTRHHNQIFSKTIGKVTSPRPCVVPDNIIIGAPRASPPPEPSASALCDDQSTVCATKCQHGIAICCRCNVLHHKLQISCTGGVLVKHECRKLEHLFL